MASCWGCTRRRPPEDTEDARSEGGSSAWRYVGDGRGAYEKVSSYGYVGTGGAWEKQEVEVPYGVRPRICCLVFLLIATLGLAVMVVQQARSAATTAQPTERPSAIIQHPRFSCVLDRQYAAVAGQPREEGTPVPSPPLAPTLGAIIGASLVEAAWTMADSDSDGLVRRADLRQCLDAGQLSPRAVELVQSADFGATGAIDHHAFVSALTRVDPSDDALGRGRLFDAYADAAWLVLDANSDSRVTRQELGTLKWYRTLPKEAMHALLTADADADGSLGRWELLAVLRRAAAGAEPGRDDGGLVAGAMEAELESWTRERRTYCCLTAGVGCALPSMPAPSSTSLVAGAVALPSTPGGGAAEEDFDCEAGYYAWKLRWSVLHQAWCCQHYNRGCAEVSTSLPYNCSDGFSSWEQSWSVGKKDWCCRHVGRGCSPGLAT